jgi:hypothetical protein
MRKILFSIILVIGLATAAYAQDYNTGLGLRGGTGWGITLKHFVSQRNAFEGFFYEYNDGFNVTGLYQCHSRAFDVDYLRWYYGFGAHIGSYNYNAPANKGDFVLGVDGIIGIEYTFTEAPICIGLDWNPHLNFTGYTGFMPGFGALSIRYTF